MTQTSIEILTRLLDAMEENNDRLFTIVEELSNKCWAQNDKITDHTKYRSNVYYEIITYQI
jgi:hypothetical protein